MYNLNAGQSYTIVVAAVNGSKDINGSPVAANMSVAVAAVIGGTSILSQQQSYGFAIGESHNFSFNVSVPANLGGQSGTITASLLDPAGNVIPITLPDGTTASQVSEGITIAAPGVDLVVPIGTYGSYTIHDVNGIGFSSIGAATVTCPTCGGSGLVLDIVRSWGTGQNYYMTCPTCNGTGKVPGEPYAILSQPITLTDLTQGLTVNFTLNGPALSSGYYNTDDGGSSLTMFLRFYPNFTTQIAPPVLEGDISVPLVGRYWNVPFSVTVPCKGVYNAGRMTDGQVSGSFDAEFTPTSFVGVYIFPPCRVKGIILG